jgi:hypothetical protein
VSAAPGSALARARAAFEAKQVAAEPKYVDLWRDGSLVAQVKRPDDTAGASAVIRTIAALTSSSTSISADLEAQAAVIAAATINLGCFDDAGSFEPFGAAPMTFDAAFAASMGWPPGLDPADMVCFAFTDGSPPELDTIALGIAAANVASTLAVAGQREQEDARAAVGEA